MVFNADLADSLPDHLADDDDDEEDHDGEGENHSTATLREAVLRQTP